MQGTILIIDGVSTNRIMLKVQLSAAWYHVVQADRLAQIRPLIRRSRPDLIISAMDLPDGSVTDLRHLLASDPAFNHIPIIAVTAQNDRPARLRALQADINDVLSQPIDDLMLQARIRRLLRTRSQLDKLQLDHTPAAALGMAETTTDFVPGPKTRRVALLTQVPATGPVWRSRLQPHLPHKIECYPMRDVQGLMHQPTPDAVILELPHTSDAAGLRLLADLRARGTTRDAIVIAVPNPSNAALAAEALDRGAHDALPQGFCAEELALRLSAHLRRKAVSDHIRDSLRTDLQAAMQDPMTGLYNRRYALPKLGQMARTAAEAGRDFAVMMMDLDHFKQVNDRFGHLSGDAVLIETAHRMRAMLHPSAIVSRVGGEEFLIGLPEAGADLALETADLLCRRINDTPFHVPGARDPIHVTTSIGIAIGPDHRCPVQDMVSAMITRADRALYMAKTAGRNQATLSHKAA